MLRSIAGVVAALVAWVAIATLGNVLLRLALPGYADVEGAMEFSITMLWARLLLGMLSSISAGLVVAWVTARNRRDVLVLSGLLLALFIPVHYSLWMRFPVWYHVVFLLSLVVGTMIGGKGFSWAFRPRTKGFV